MLKLEYNTVMWLVKLQKILAHSIFAAEAVIAFVKGRNVLFQCQTK